MEKTSGAVNLLNLTAQTSLSNLPNIGKAGTAQSDISFSETFSKTGTKQEVNYENEIAKSKTVVEKTSVTSNIRSAGEGQKEQSLGNDKIKEIAKEVEKAVDEIKEEIKTKFSVSDDDIDEAMEVLGLMMQDLFNQKDLRSLVMEITGTNESIELLTNVELYDGLKDVSFMADELFKGISEEFGLSLEGLTEVIDTEAFTDVLENVGDEINVDTDSEVVDFKNNEQPQMNVEVNIARNETENTETVETTAETVIDEENVEKLFTDTETTETEKVLNTTDKEENVETVVKEGTVSKETEIEKKPEQEVTVERSQEARTADPVVTNTTTQNNGTSENNSRKQNFDNNRNQEMNLQTTNVTTQTVNTVGDIVETVTSYTSYADTENIMRQVTDYVKVNVTEDVTKMEMQLHPASLGTVNMQINSQNGQITAHLTVQNELVKSILESQMIKLQETFNEQGTKVTAIEVSVANYSLDSKSDNSYSQSGENNNRRGNGRRGINLSELSSFDELTDEEQLQAEVMEMNGSSVNYTA